MTTPDLPERCKRCKNCSHFMSVKHGDATLPNGICLVLAVRADLPLWAQATSHRTAEYHGTDCPAFEPADKEGTERE
jgi:hypothetical protein